MVTGSKRGIKFRKHYHFTAMDYVNSLYYCSSDKLHLQLYNDRLPQNKVKDVIKILLIIVQIIAFMKLLNS